MVVVAVALVVLVVAADLSLVHLVVARGYTQAVAVVPVEQLIRRVQLVLPVILLTAALAAVAVVQEVQQLASVAPVAPPAVAVAVAVRVYSVVQQLVALVAEGKSGSTAGNPNFQTPFST